MYGKALLTLILVLSLQCESTGERERPMSPMSGNPEHMYGKYLVRINQYTTKGSYYHKKYYRQLLEVAHAFNADRSLRIVERSIGFYHDKKRKDDTKLYMGIDFSFDNSDVEGRGYGERISNLLTKQLPAILPVLMSQKEIHSEKEIAGIVVSMRWKQGWSSEHFNFWLLSDEARLYEKNRLTLKELIQRNTITDMNGNIIRLTR
ncbi:MAG TPA: hypothetical protein PLT75_12185 [Spirochaetota bacterium]|nr:hypothetical protein [Spirochaetota bacterium]